MTSLLQQRHRNRGPMALGLFVLACMPLNAIANSFTAEDEAALRANLATAASNGVSDTIDLNGAIITLENGPLTYVGSGEPQLTIQNGTLLAAPDSNIIQITGSASSLDSVVVSNMTFSNGDREADRDDDVAPGRGQGGAIFSTLPLVIKGSTFNNNRAQLAGGAVYGLSSIQVSNSFFERNRTRDAGGAINGLSSITIDVSFFNDNSGSRGGAVFSGFSSSLAITGSTFAENTTSSLGGAIFAVGSSSVSISESSFINNEALAGGGALYFQSLPEAAQISRVTMWDNGAAGTTGSAIRNFASSVNLVNTFIGSNVDDDSANCQRQDGSLNGVPIVAEFFAVGGLSTDISCGSPSDSGATGAEREVFASFFGSEALLTDEAFAVGSGSGQGLPILIPAENGPLDDALADVCGGLDQRGNAVVDGMCDIGSVELLPTEQDTDFDGTNDEQDNCPLLANDQDANVDGDQFGDACDDDIDGDGTLNGDDAFPREVDEATDTDGDGTGNNADTDDDNDGVADTDDAFPTDASESADTDGDGIGNNADTDDDGDGQSDAHEAECGSNPLEASSTSADTDNDGIPDCVDPDFVDTDEDGVSDDLDNCPATANPNQEDADGNGVGDACEIQDDLQPVTVYQHINFRGSSLSVSEGDVSFGDLRASSVGNDRISSIEIAPGYEVTACQHGGLRGRCETFTSSVSDLRDISFNDVISSLLVRRVSEQPVTVFVDVNFRGNSLSVGEGDLSFRDLRASSVGNDRISSIIIAPGYEVIACQHGGFRGRCETFTGTVTDLRGISFNDVISSLRVQPL